MRQDKRRDNEFWESLRNNMTVYNSYLDRLTELSIAMFEWKNLPDTVDARYLEKTLFLEGKAIFFYDKAIGYLALQMAEQGNYNVYGIPTQRRAIGYNGYQVDLKESESVIIFNNMLHTPSMRDCQIYSVRLADLDRTIDVNARAQKTPILLKCKEQERLSLLNLYKEYDGNQPVIFGDKGLNTDSIQTIDTGAPYIADKLYELKTNIWNEVLTYLGISNVSINKKERLITDEVQRAQGGTIASRYSRLDMRKNACDEINRKFGLNISVDFRQDLNGASIDDKSGENKPKEGGNNNE